MSKIPKRFIVLKDIHFKGKDYPNNIYDCQQFLAFKGEVFSRRKGHNNIFESSTPEIFGADSAERELWTSNFAPIDREFVIYNSTEHQQLEYLLQYVKAGYILFF